MAWPRRGAAAVVAAFALAGGAAAQTGPRMIDTGRIDQLPSSAPRAAPTRAGEAAAPPAAPPPLIAAVQSFRLTEVQVIGAEGLPPGSLDPAWRPALGQEIGPVGIVALARAVEARLEALGYALRRVSVPAQDFRGGVMRIEVLLGHVSEVVLGGDAAPAGAGFVQAQIRRITAERPLRQDTLDRALALIARVPGLRVRSTAEPTADPRAIRLKLDFDWEPLQIGMGANNLGAVPLGRTQFDVGLGLNGLLGGPGDRTDFIFATPADGWRFRYYGLSHSRPIGTQGLMLRLSAGYFRTKESETTTDGDATTFGIALSYPVLLQARREVSVEASFDGVNSESALLGFTISNERTRALRAGVSYVEQQQWDGTTAVRLVVSTGLEVFGARAGSVIAGGPDFFKAVLQLYREQELPGPFVLRLVGLGQVADQALPASEALLFGGRPFGRGFPQASLQGDNGVLGTAELGLRLEMLDVGPLSRSEVYGFIDGGELRSIDWRRRGLPERVSAASAGVGVRATLASRLVGDVYVARGIADDAPGIARRGWSVLFTLRSSLPGPIR